MGRYTGRYTLCALWLALGGIAQGDVIYFTRGHYVEAEAVDRGDNWLLLPVQAARIRLPRPKAVPKTDVLKIVFEKDFSKEFDARQQKTDSDDMPGQDAILKWCHQEHFTVYAERTAKSALEALKERVKKDGEPDALCEAAQWANGSPQRYYLPKGEAARLFQTVLDADPDHEAAHRGLKHKQHDGQWVTAEEYRRLKRASSRRPARTKKKRGKEPVPVWLAALANRLPFDTQSEAIVEQWGPAQRQQTRTSRQNEAEETIRLSLYYEADGLTTCLEFRDNKLSGYSVRPTRSRDDSDEPTLDGKVLSEKDRRKALKEAAALRRVGLGVAMAEVEAILGRPDETNVHTSSRRSTATETWYYRPGDGRWTYLTFRDERLYMVNVHRLSY